VCGVRIEVMGWVCRCGRYGPARRELERAWRALPKAKMDTITLMQNTCYGIAECTGSDEWATWTANCGRTVSKKHGPHQVAQDMRIAAPKSFGTLAMTRGSAKATGDKYSMLRVSNKTRVAVAKFEALGEIVSQTRAPTTVMGWNEQFASIVANCAGVPGVQGEYSKAWFARSVIVAAMRRRGIEKLKLLNCSVDDLAMGCPDQSKHIVRFGSGHSTAYGMLNEIAYDGPPELFSMYCCLFSDPMVAKVLDAKPVAWARGNMLNLRRARREYEAMWGQTPHPAVLLQSFALQP
jgi:hypothetical protein